MEESDGVNHSKEPNVCAPRSETETVVDRKRDTDVGEEKNVLGSVPLVRVRLGRTGVETVVRFIPV